MSITMTLHVVWLDMAALSGRPSYKKQDCITDCTRYSITTVTVLQAVLVVLILL